MSTQIPLGQYGPQYSKDNPEDVLAFIQSNNPKHIKSYSTMGFYRVGFRVGAKAIMTDNGVKVSFSNDSDHFPKLNNLSVIVQSKKPSITAVRMAIEALTLDQIKQALA